MMARPPEHIYPWINGWGIPSLLGWDIWLSASMMSWLAMPCQSWTLMVVIAQSFYVPPRTAKLTAYPWQVSIIACGCVPILWPMMADLHGHGHAFIDLKKPICALMQSQARAWMMIKAFIVGFIDCDISYRITASDGSVYLVCYHPEMTSPEYHEHKDIGLLDEKHDRFVLAIELFKIFKQWYSSILFYPCVRPIKKCLPIATPTNLSKERLYALWLAATAKIAPLKTVFMCLGWPNPGDVW